MNDMIEEKTTYKFERITSYSNGETYTDVKMWTQDALDNDYWPDIATSFLLWLGSIYGYDILGQVKLPDEYQDTFSKRHFDSLNEKAGVSYDDI